MCRKPWNVNRRFPGMVQTMLYLISQDSLLYVIKLPIQHLTGALTPQTFRLQVAVIPVVPCRRGENCPPVAIETGGRVLVAPLGVPA